LQRPNARNPLRYNQNPAPLACSDVRPLLKHPRDVRRETQQLFPLFLEVRQRLLPETRPVPLWASPIEWSGWNVSLGLAGAPVWPAKPTRRIQASFGFEPL